jgi:preprotein translocase subunit YajC
MISDLFLILAQTPPPAGPPTPPDAGLNMLVWMIFAFVLVYFLTIRPQRKKQLELEAQIKALKAGDKVVTLGGLHGVVINTRGEKEPVLSLRIGGSLVVDLDKSAVARVLRDKPDDVKA